MMCLQTILHVFLLYARWPVLEQEHPEPQFVVGWTKGKVNDVNWETFRASFHYHVFDYALAGHCEFVSIIFAKNERKDQGRS
ncbi:hypothetical protein BKA67DRAFT_583798 [Truncatella angustata]|uniref:Uncharacterized protein n=1 Tax=Truncatella angustata TaxID=152316 RepID=A0A9P8UCJ3_9PEZI|nr:uncharacterized protein BKA67DRAFT_583798 [Truncatella angustata]KAH6646295.1 hypothetical protein BKA67DRAFT_583798 [Truncatella angustata]